MKILRKFWYTLKISVENFAIDALALALNLFWFRLSTLRISRSVHCIVPNSVPFLWSVTTCHWQEVSSSTLSTILKLTDARKRVSAVYSGASTRERGWPGVSIVLRLGCKKVQSFTLFDHGDGQYEVPKGRVAVIMMQTKPRPRPALTGVRVQHQFDGHITFQYRNYFVLEKHTYQDHISGD